MVEKNRIQELSLEDVMGERFGRYSKYIIQERALPDIRDGLKPVQRRILFAMKEDGNTFDHPYRKSAKAVGNVMGNYHPHGDSSIYEALVRMSQNWKMREPLIDMNGNNGSIDNDPPAAMRYTEARLSPFSQELLADLDQKTVDMVLNFDDTRYEPTVLPSRIPNLLINGASGISAGYATEIPPHNLGEVIDGLVFLLAHPQADLDQLMKFVKGPDFPTGAIVQGIKGIREAYQTGRGRIYIRAKTEIEDLKAGKKQIKITELPYEVNKAALVSRIDEIRVNHEVNGITEVRDDTSREGLLVVIELSKDADPQGVLDFLFKKTSLQQAYNFNMTAIENQRPVSASLKQMLSAFKRFRQEVITRRTNFELEKALSRQEIVDGLIKMISILDQVIITIRSSKNRRNAKDNLIKKFDFTDHQAEAIVTLQLYRLTNTDVAALQKEAKELADKIAYYRLILSDQKELNKVLKKELLTIKKLYANPRRSKIEDEISQIKIDKTVVIAKEEAIIQVTKKGYLKRASYRSYKASEDNGLSKDDYPVFLTKTNTLKQLFIFTNKGHLIYKPIHQIAESRWKDLGEHLSQTTSGLLEDEYVVSVIIYDYPLSNEQKKESILLTSSDSFIKQISVENILPTKYYKKRVNTVISVKENADLVSAVKLSGSEKEIIMVSQRGSIYKLALSEIPAMGAKSSGSKPIRLLSKDRIIDIEITDPNKSKALMLLTERGHYKLIDPLELPISTRGSLKRTETVFMSGDIIGGAQLLAQHTKNELKAFTNTSKTISFVSEASNISEINGPFKPKVKVEKNSIIVGVRKNQEVN